LKYVDLRDIGDMQLKESYEMYKDLPDLIGYETDDDSKDESTLVNEKKNECTIF
jgi:hypothetical protein